MLALTVIPAVWHVVDFEEDIDLEFPAVIRPTFSRVPPAAYRLAEPGDTLDRIMIYFSAAGLVLSGAGLVLARGGGLWPAALSLGAAGLWYSGTPGPDVRRLVWPGLAIDRATPTRRSVCARRLLAAAIAICGVIVANLYFAHRHRLRGIRGRAH